MTRRRFKLRDETRDAHERVDRAIQPLFGSLDGYGVYLRGAHQARAKLEAMVSDLRPPMPNLGELVIAADIALDLGDLRIASPSAASVEPLDIAQPGVPEQCGIVYVLAGSSLGAVHLRGMAAELGLSDGFGARHLARQASATKLWPALVDALEWVEMSPEEEERCTNGALLAFTEFQRALDV
jgi:heme oxygenase